ncbi:hypothetical protein AUL38_02620 [Leucobacter sp. G161]|nr:hypothetical protein AUL38_02620 [Leucobacter sp. G161]
MGACGERVAPVASVAEGWFTHIAWAIDLTMRGPCVRPSARRRDYEFRLVNLAEKLRGEGAVTAHALAVEMVVPIMGAPAYDLALLVHTPTPSADALVARTAALGLPAPELTLSGRNGGRFGDTEEQSGAILLNHFAGTTTPDRAVEAWKAVSTWYERTLRVDNSTLLQFDADSPFLMMNYAVLPGRVVPFLAGQVLRPTFHSVVRRQLRAANLSPFPLFARRLGP